MSSKLIKIKHVPAIYVTISQICAEDRRISWGARGLFCYLHGRPEGWTVNFVDLCRRSKDGKSKLNKYIKELQKYNYLKIEINKDERGRWAGTVWFTDDMPETSENVDKSQSCPYPQKPEYGKPICGKTGIRRLGTIQYNNIKDNKTKKQQHKTAHPPVVVPDDFKNPKPPCQNGHKCHHFRDMDTVINAMNIYQSVVEKKDVVNPTGYVCMICRKGAILPRGFQTPAEIAAGKEAKKQKKAIEVREEETKAERETKVKAAFAALPQSEKNKYICRVRQSMGLKLCESILIDVAAGKWAEEANYAI